MVVVSCFDVKFIPLDNKAMTTLYVMRLGLFMFSQAHYREEEIIPYFKKAGLKISDYKGFQMLRRRAGVAAGVAAVIAFVY